MSKTLRTANTLFPAVADVNGNLTGANPNNPFDGATVTTSAAFTSVPVFVGDCDAFSIEFSTLAASTLAGTLTLQACSHRSSSEGGGASVLGTDLGDASNWQTLSFWDVGAGAQATSKAVSSGANALILAERACTYRWVRLVFAFTSGSGKPKVSAQLKLPAERT